MLSQVIVLIKKDYRLERRNSYALASQLLYLVGTVFICYLSIKLKGGKLTPNTWVALFWIINLFSAITAASRSFQQESRNRNWYYYPLCNPQALVLSKTIFNTLQMWLLGTLAYGAFLLILGNEVQDLFGFFITVLVGNFCFAACLTMVSAIVSIAQGNATLMAVMSFPILIPSLLLNNKLSKIALDGLDISLGYSYWGMLIALGIASLALSLILFPYLWKSQSH